jgi:hypothetical protein
MCIRKPALAGVACLAVLAGCAGLSAAITKFEERAAPAVARACGIFHAAEASPLVQTGLAVGAGAITAGTGVPAGLVLSSVRSFGDQFCAAGPQPGDASTPTQQAQWLLDVTQKMIAAAAAAAGAVK